MKIAIRTDASSKIGTGHVMRCLVLAKALIDKKHDVIIYSRPLPGNLIHFCQQQGIDVYPLPAATCDFPPDHDSYLHWLGVSQQQDAHETLAAIEGFEPDWIVADHYALGQEWQAHLRQTGAKILVIDDLANRNHDCDLLLGQSPVAGLEHSYTSKVPAGAQLLIGLDFALLRPQFSALRKKHQTKKNQLMAFFGGTDPTGECVKLLKACQHIERLPFDIKIVYGMASPFQEALLTEAIPDFVTLDAKLEHFEVELSQSRYAFGGVGGSAIERSCLGVASTLVTMAENQRPMAEYLHATGHFRYLGNGDSTTVQSYVNELNWLVTHWFSIPASFGADRIDGLGVLRVIDWMEQLNGR